MSNLIKTGWLEDNDGNKFAPKTLSSQVVTPDGTLLEDKIQSEFDKTSNKVDNLSEEVVEVKKSMTSGSTGQFATSDGKGGINWITLHNAEEVEY